MGAVPCTRLCWKFDWTPCLWSQNQPLCAVEPQCLPAHGHGSIVAVDLVLLVQGDDAHEPQDPANARDLASSTGSIAICAARQRARADLVLLLRRDQGVSGCVTGQSLAPSPKQSHDTKRNKLLTQLDTETASQ